MFYMNVKDIKSCQQPSKQNIYMYVLSWALTSFSIDDTVIEAI